MNRINSLAPSVPFSNTNKKSLVTATRKNRQVPAPAGIQTFAPLHYEPNYAYPLLVWIHDDGGDARELQKVMPLISMRNYVGVSISGEVLASGRGHAWRQSSEGTIAAETQLCDAIELATQKFRIHSQRIFLAGNAAGGTMALRLGLRNPDRFAGAMTLGGSFPTGQAPLAMLTAARRLPLFIAHCRDSERYPVEQLCDELRLFHTAGLAATIRQYPCSDEVTTQMLKDVDVWLMERVTGQPCEPVPAPIPEEWN
ncbi:alpha/beta hydrolase [Anatilimnocola sp. NA78]|uniref:alpha/beta hydrolase n=1 Tax=Anatilimnocola sp. NA78 TaxID=3415683 RepID=UPI003CE4CF59